MVLTHTWAPAKRVLHPLWEVRHIPVGSVAGFALLQVSVTCLSNLGAHLSFLHSCVPAPRRPPFSFFLATHVAQEGRCVTMRAQLHALLWEPNETQRKQSDLRTCCEM